MDLPEMHKGFPLYPEAPYPGPLLVWRGEGEKLPLRLRFRDSMSEFYESSHPEPLDTTVAF